MRSSNLSRPHGIGAALCALTLVAVTKASGTNYVPDPGFEICSWTPTATEAVTCDGTDPREGSFSLSVTNPPSVGFAGARSTCIAVPPNTSILNFGFSYRTSSVTVYQVALTVEAFTDGACTTPDTEDSTGVGFQYGQTLVVDGAWHALAPRVASVDPGTHSLRFTASFQHTPTSASATVNFDDLSYADQLIFANGFESGGLCSWSSTAPPIVCS